MYVESTRNHLVNKPNVNVNLNHNVGNNINWIVFISKYYPQLNLLVWVSAPLPKSVNITKLMAKL